MIVPQRPEPSSLKTQVHVRHLFPLQSRPFNLTATGPRITDPTLIEITQKPRVEYPTGDLDDIVSCYIHSPTVPDSVLNSPDDMLHIPQAVQDGARPSNIIRQNPCAAASLK